jgi:hypothetical protein
LTPGDPVLSGLVASLNRPGGNATGVYGLSPELEPKRLGLLHQLLPKAKRIAALYNPAAAGSSSRELQTAAATIGMDAGVLGAFSSAMATADRLLSICGRSGKPSLRGGDRRVIAHIQPRLAVGDMSARQAADSLQERIRCCAQPLRPPDRVSALGKTRRRG